MKSSAKLQEIIFVIIKNTSKKQNNLCSSEEFLNGVI